MARDARDRSRGAYFTARLIFGENHPAIPFAILLAITSDTLGFVALAVVEPHACVASAGVLIIAIAMGLAGALRASAS